ncbi:hypothetical protein IIQ44_20245 [Acinetobacter oleivorans]|uniref:hypothetical protein n=1 Tax=Acinetobacter TaxID=469 RepID=UPI0014869FA8|nr:MULTISPECIES: hypothetical protein [Acinetobacter]MBE2174221.1 hypothetical protein [Acinetobacter oleivorans]HCI7190475.1 hypothetical protein [Acinetobacter baumannii]
MSASEAARISQVAKQYTIEELKDEVGSVISTIASKGEKILHFPVLKSRASVALVIELQQILLDLGYDVELDVLHPENYIVNIKF